MKKLIVLIIGIVLVLSTWAQAVNISDTKLAALEARVAQQEAEIAQLKEAIKIIADTAKKDVENRDRFNKGLGDSIVRAKERLDSAESSDLALSKAQDLLAKKQEALGKEQYALAARYDAAIDAATKEVRRKNQVVRSSDMSVNVARARERAKQDSLKTEAIISQALTTAGLREEDRELLCLYDIYSQGSSLGQYKRYLKEIGQEAKFTQFEQVARQLTQAGIFKSGIVRIRLGENSGTVVADPLDMPRICSRMIANYKEKRLTKSREPYVTKVSQKDPPRTAYRIQRKGADLDGFYTKIGRSGSRDRDDRD